MPIDAYELEPPPDIRVEYNPDMLSLEDREWLAEQQESEDEFALLDDDGAEHIGRSIHALLSEKAALTAIFKKKVARIESRLNAIVFLHANKLADYIKRRIPEGAKRRSVDLSTCSMTNTKKSATLTLADEAAAIEWCFANDYGKFVSEKLDWAGLKKALMATGELADGVKGIEAFEAPSLTLPGLGRVSAKTGKVGALTFRMDNTSLSKIGFEEECEEDE